MNKRGRGFAHALEMRWQRIVHAVQMLPEQEWPDVAIVLWQVLVGWPCTGRAVTLAWQALPVV